MDYELHIVSVSGASCQLRLVSVGILVPLHPSPGINLFAAGVAGTGAGRTGKQFLAEPLRHPPRTLTQPPTATPSHCAKE